MLRTTVCLMLSAAFGGSAMAHADEAITAAKTNLGRAVDFDKDIAPIFRANCVACHNRTKREGDFIIEDVVSILKGGGSGDVVVPGKPDDSYLYNVAARVEESYMPPLPNTVQAKALTPEQVGLLRQWILEGAKASEATAASTLAWQSINSGLNAIYAVDTDPTGKYVAAGRSGNVTVYDLQAAGHVSHLVDPQLTTSPQQQTHRDYVNAIAFSPAGDVLATAGYRNIKLWRRESPHVGQDRATETLSQSVPALKAGDADGRLTLTRTGDGSVFTAESGTAAPVTAVHATADAQRVLLLLADGTVRPAMLHDDGTLGLGEILKSDNGAIRHVQTGGSVVMFQIGRNLELRSADGVNIARTITHSTDFQSVSLSSDGLRIATVDTEGLSQLWNAADGKLIASLQVSLRAQQQQDRCRTTKDVWNARVNVVQAQITEAEKRVTEQNDSVKKAKEAVTKAEEELQKAKTKQDEEAKKVATAQEQLQPKPDDAGLKKRLTDAMTAKTKADEVVAAAEAKLKSNRRGVELSEQAVQRAEAVVAATKQRLTDTKAALAAAETAVSTATTAAETAITSSLTAFVGNETVATLDPSGTLRLWQASDGASVDVLENSWDQFQPTTLTSLGNLLVVRSDKAVKVLNTRPNWTLSAVLGPRQNGESVLADRVLSLAFSPDGTMLAAGGGEASRSGELTLWNVADGQLVHQFADAHSDTVYGLDFSKDGQFLASAAADKFVKVFDVASRKFVRSYEGHTHHVMDVSWKGDGTRLASAGADNAIKVWNADTGEQTRTISTYKKQVTALEFIGIGDEFISSSGDKRIFRHRASNGGTVREFRGCPDYVYCAAVTADGTVVAAGCEDGVLRVWDGISGKQLQSFGP
ncbi:MAG: hypothetical protein NXI04_24275 [Planctomycetaceae bacterium]|nr:hypothetical protein [Planctomycetaceae bacterium]